MKIKLLLRKDGELSQRLTDSLNKLAADLATFCNTSSFDEFKKMIIEDSEMANKFINREGE